jgi:CBS domain-containing protein
MKVRELMTSPVIRIRKNETVEVAARTLAHYNIGVLPVCGEDGRVCGVVTDRDLVTRCLASGRNPVHTTVGDVMSDGVVGISGELDTGAAIQVMAEKQIRRLPVIENGKLRGMVTLGDLAKAEDNTGGTGAALGQISSNITGIKNNEKK